jgi:hypothetical protein
MGKSGIKIMARYVNWSMLLLGLSSFCSAYADETADLPEISKWKMSSSPQLLYSSFSGATSRESLLSAGVGFDAQYLEQGGLSASIASTQLTLKTAASATTTNLNQTDGSLSGRMNFTPDFLSGRLTLRTDILRADNNDASNETNNVNVIAPQVSYLNYAKTFYLDLGYARSSYGDSANGNGSLMVTQWTPTFGFGFNEGGDWLQLRAYNITPSNPARAQNYSSTNAGEVKWTHFFYPDGFIPEQIQLGALFGKRIYAVDGTSIYNLADMQEGGASLGAQWLLAQDTHLFVQAGHNLYNAGAGSNYSGSYAYFSLINQW